MLNKKDVTKVLSDSNKAKKIRIILIVIGVILMLTLAYDLLIGGKINYAINYAKCGEKPVLVDYNPLNSTPLIYYVLPTQIEDYDISSRDEYFCSEQEAIDAGYRQSPLAL